MNRWKFVPAMIFTVFVAYSSTQGAGPAYLAAPTSPQTYGDPRLPQAPTPGGPVPNSTFAWPFEVVPPYYQPPAQWLSPYARYLLMSPSTRSFRAVDPLYIPQYWAPPYQPWPGTIPLR